MSTLIIPDLHGNVEVAQWALDQKQHNLVFLGDYLDSFFESRARQRQLLSMVLSAAENQSGRVTALAGNHEMSYLNELMRASGYSRKMDDKIAKYKNSMKLHLKPYTWVGKYLISHAGVSQKFLNYMGTTLNNYLQSGLFGDIGRSRGGRAPAGGLYWCDWYDDFTPIDGVPQIVGHTSSRSHGERKKKIVTKIDNYGELSYNTDCLLKKGKKHFLVINDDETIEKIKVKL